MKALLEIIEYLEKRDRLDAALKRGLAEFGVPLHVLYDGAKKGDADPFAARERLEDEEAVEALDAIEERARRKTARRRRGKSGGSRRPAGSLNALASALAARRACDAAALGGFERLAARLPTAGAGRLDPREDDGEKDVEATRRALRAVIDAPLEAVAEAAALVAEREGPPGLARLCDAAMADQHLPLERRDPLDPAPLPAGPALSSYRMLLETMNPSALRVAWVLRHPELAFGFEAARAQIKLAAALRHGLGVAPLRFSAPLKPFAPGRFGFLCGALSAARKGGEASSAWSYAGLALKACEAGEGTRRAFLRGLVIGYGAAGLSAAAAMRDPAHPAALFDAYRLAGARVEAIARESARPARPPRGRPSGWRAAETARLAQERRAAKAAFGAAHDRLHAALHMLEPWTLAAPAEGAARGASAG